MYTKTRNQELSNMAWAFAKLYRRPRKLMLAVVSEVERRYVCIYLCIYLCMYISTSIEITYLCIYQSLYLHIQWCTYVSMCPSSFSILPTPARLSPLHSSIHKIQESKKQTQKHDTFSIAPSPGPPKKNKRQTSLSLHYYYHYYSFF